MKTTVEIPDDLIITAKQRAAAQRRPLRALIEEGLRRVLYEEPGRASHANRVKWVVAEGGVPPETANRETMYEWMEKNR